MHSTETYFLTYLITYLIICIIHGAITKAIARSRGMEGGFGWGFWLWIIGIIIVAVRPNDNKRETAVVTPYASTAENAAVSPLAALQIHGEKDVFELPGNLYTEGSPVVISSGLLMKDEQTSRVFAKLTFQSINSKPIIAARVCIHPMDAAGRSLGDDVEYDYLDLNVNIDESFGKTLVIPMPNASTREFTVEVREVIFADKSVWSWDNNVWEPMPSHETDIGDAELRKQYQLHFGKKAIYKALRYKDLWLCSCGAINKNEQETCRICSNRIEDLLSCDWDELAVERNQRLEIENKDREAKEAAERAAAEAASKKKQKTISIVVPALIICIAVLLIITKDIIPNINYSRAKKLLDTEQYQEAIAAFEALNDYKDSKKQLYIARVAKARAERIAREAQIEAERIAREAQIEAANALAYENAEALFADGDFDGAINAFLELGNYRDSISKIEEVKAAKSESIYVSALALADGGQYEKAMTTLKELGSYKDSDAQLLRITKLYYSKEWRDIKAGDIIKFGCYEQDYITKDKEAIEWIVLERTDDRILVISKYALDAVRYNDSHTSTTWEQCSLRKWLNETFLSEAFTKEETAMIPKVSVSADKNSQYGTDPGKETSDWVFLLSTAEAEKYFKTNDSRKSIITTYASHKGIGIYDYTCWCPLRTPGISSECCAGIHYDGHVDYHGDYVSAPEGLRPALWISLS